MPVKGDTGKAKSLVWCGFDRLRTWRHENVLFRIAFPNFRHLITNVPHGYGGFIGVKTFSHKEIVGLGLKPNTTHSFRYRKGLLASNMKTQVAGRDGQLFYDRIRSQLDDSKVFLHSIKESLAGTLFFDSGTHRVCIENI